MRRANGMMIACTALLMVLALALVTMFCGCKGSEEKQEATVPPKAPASLAGAPAGAPVMKGDPSAVPASGMKAGKAALQPPASK